MRGLEPPQIANLTAEAQGAGVSVEPWLAWARVMSFEVGVLEATRQAVAGIRTQPLWAELIERAEQPRRRTARRWSWQAGRDA